MLLRLCNIRREKVSNNVAFMQHSTGNVSSDVAFMQHSTGNVNNDVAFMQHLSIKTKTKMLNIPVVEV